MLVAWNGCLPSTRASGVIGPGAGTRSSGSWSRGALRAARSARRPWCARRRSGRCRSSTRRGTAYLSSHCSGTVAIAPAHSRQLPPAIVTRGAAQSFTLALSGAGQGLAAWVAGACSYERTAASTPGPVLVSVLRAGGFAAPFALSRRRRSSVDAVASPAGVTVSWSPGRQPDSRVHRAGRRQRRSGHGAGESDGASARRRRRR